MRFLALLFVMFLSFSVFAQEEEVIVENVIVTDGAVSKDGVLRFIVDSVFTDTFMYDAMTDKSYLKLYGNKPDNKNIYGTFKKRNPGFKYLIDVYADGVKKVEEARASGNKVEEELGQFMCLISYAHMVEIKQQASLRFVPSTTAIVVGGRKVADNKTAKYFDVMGYSEAQKKVIEEFRDDLFHPSGFGGGPLLYISESGGKPIVKSYNKYLPLFKAASAN